MKKVSVIIPAYNSEKTILNCILSLKKQKYKNFEIIAVDDGSTDNTESILKKIKGIKVISQKNRGQGAARNEGARKAKGEIVVFIDSDCEARNKLWLKKLVDTYEKDKRVVGMASGYSGSIGKEFIEEYAYLELKYRLRKMPENVLTASSSNISCRKRIFNKIGGFPEDKRLISAEDILFSYNLSRKGILLWKKELGIFHKFRSTLKEYLKQQEGFVKADVLLFLKHPKLLSKVTNHSKNVYLQILLTFLFFASLLASFFRFVFLRFSLLILVGIALLNANFLLFLRKQKDSRFMRGGFSVILLRNIYYISGILRGIKCAVYAGS